MVDPSGLDATKSNQSAAKVLLIIECLAEALEPLRLMDISHAVHLNNSTTSRFLSTLIQCGYVEQNSDTSRYFLTFKLCTLANKISAKISLRELAAPYMRELSRVFGESVCLAVEQNNKVVYIEVVEGPDQMIRSMQRIGNVAPLHCTGIGKLFLLSRTPEEIRAYTESGEFQRFTAFTLTTLEQLLNELDAARRLGYAYDNQECEIGARCVAYPIRDQTGQVVAGLSVTGPVGRLTDSFIGENMDTLMHAGDVISQKLGYESR